MKAVTGFGCESIARLRRGRRTGRVSSWDKTGRNGDSWTLAPGETRVLADLRGPGQITHIWFAQPTHFREVLLRITWDDAPRPSVLCPVGDFFGLGNGFTNSYQSALFSASTSQTNQMGYDADGKSRRIGTALNCYAPMPFRKRAVVELINESDEPHPKWFYVDYETFEDGWDDELGYFHAEFRRAHPFGGWGGDLAINTDEVDIPCTKRFAWENNYTILETRGRGQYIGCNLSVANLCGGWWGEGDDMIWVDGYKWPPDLHGTGSEDYLGHAWGMQPNAFWRNGSSVFEGHTQTSTVGGYQTSYVFHLENPVYFEREIKVTIEAGHGNHLRNDVSSTAYWYAAEPAPAKAPPPVRQRRPVLRDAHGVWLIDRESQCPGPQVTLTPGILAAAPAVAAALAPGEPVVIDLAKLPARLALAGVERALAGTAAHTAAVGGDTLATFRFGLSGDRLAVVADVSDPAPARVEPDFWKGSSVEIFAAPEEGCVPGQAFFLTAPGAGAAGEARLYRQAIRLPDSAAVQWRTRKRRGGYRLVALLPLACLGLDPAARAFLVEAAVNVPGPRGAARRAGLVTTASQAWTSSRRFARAKV